MCLVSGGGTAVDRAGLLRDGCGIGEVGGYVQRVDKVDVLTYIRTCRMRVWWAWIGEAGR